AHPLEGLLHGGHHVGDRDAGNVLGLDPARSEKRLDEHAILVGGLFSPAGEPPRHEQSAPIEHADAGVRVADFDDEQHHALPCPGFVTADTTRVRTPRPASTSSAPESSTSIATPSPPSRMCTRWPSMLARLRHSRRSSVKPLLNHSPYRRSRAASVADRSGP